MRRTRIALTLVLLGFIGCGPTRQQQHRHVQSEMAAYKKQDVGAAFWIESKPDEMPAIEPSNFAEVAERLKPAVVNLNGITRVYAEGRVSESRRTSLGSGFIINKDGYIVTNNNVVENATDIKISLLDQGEFDAKVIGRDPKTDMALLKINPTRDLPVAPFGDSERLRVNKRNHTKVPDTFWRGK
jgi:S1-C subfamily serine protease